MGMQNVGGRRKREISRGNMSIFEEEQEEEEDILRRRILQLGDKFLRAWFRNKLTDNRACQLRNICEANTAPFLEGTSSYILQMASTFSEVATEGLVREIVPSGPELEQEYSAAGDLGDISDNTIDSGGRE